MAHTLQDRYSDLVKAKLRAELVLKDGIVFNNDYEGNPKAGAVKIPVRDTEVSASAYNKASGINAGTGTTTYETMDIDKDYAVNEIIDGYDAEALPDNLVADRLDSASYSLAKAIDDEGATTLLAGGTIVKNETAYTSSTIYNAIVEQRKQMTKDNIPVDGRYLLATPETFALLLQDTTHFIRASDLGDAVVSTGVVGRIAGFNVIEWNKADSFTEGSGSSEKTYNLDFVVGHPRFATRCSEFSVPVHIQDLSGSGKYVGASAVQGRNVFAHKVLREKGVRAVYTKE